MGEDAGRTGDRPPPRKWSRGKSSARVRYARIRRWRCTREQEALMMPRILFAGRPTLLGSAILVAVAAISTTKIDGKPFNASLIDLAKQGYVEEEFVLTRTART